MISNDDPSGGFPSDGLHKFLLRLPDGMRDAIASLARSNGRSMNAEIVSRLGKSLREDDERSAIKAEERVELDILLELHQSSAADARRLDATEQRLSNIERLLIGVLAKIKGQG